MKVKRILMSILLAMLAFFSGCDMKKPYLYTFDAQELKERLAGVEIVYVNGDDCEDIEALYVLQGNEIQSFLDEFLAVSVHEVGPAYSDASYYGIKLVYNDGSFNVMTAVGGCKYNAKGKFVDRGPYFLKAASKRWFYSFLLKYIELDRYDLLWKKKKTWWNDS